MKKIFVFFAIVALCSFSLVRDPLTEQERKFANDYLTETQNSLVDITQKLSDAQLKFKPAADKWSVEECVKHIAAAETGLWKMADSVINSPANPEKRSEIKLADADFMQRIRSRENKVKTFSSYEPVNTPYKSLDEAVDDFKSKRADLVKYAKTSTGNMRDHIVEGMMGMMDTYQLILVLSGHTARHTAQIEEIKQHPNFPK